MKTPDGRNGWRKVKLKNIAREITVGYVGPMAEEYVEEGIPFLRSQNIQPFRLDLSSLKFISPKFHKRIKKSALFPGDVAIVRTGYPGTACVIPNKFSELNCADLVIVRPLSDIVDAKYLVALFNSTWGQETVAGRLVGVAQQHFNVTVAKEMEVELPPLPTQQKIAAILSAYDDLIENNTRRIAILETMARLIYREWFVHFRFPGHENVRLVESEIGPVPEGWEIKAIGEIAKVKGGKRLPKGKSVQDEKTDHPYIRVKDFGELGVDLSEIKYIDEATYQSVKRYTISNTDVYISIAGTIGRVGIIPKFLSGANLTENAAKICEITKIDPRLILFYLQTSEGQAQITSKVVGTSQPKLALFRIEEIKIPVPPYHLQKQIVPFVSNCYAQIEGLQRKNDNLRRTRNLLLPRLISGEVDVAELEIAHG